MADYTIKNMWVPKSKYNIKAPYAMNPTTITIHETDNNAHPENEASYMRGNNLLTSWHAAFGDKLVVQTLPFNRNAWAAGDGVNGEGNRRSIHFEICYNKDNGYNGAMSARMIKAIDNCALYTAHVLVQLGWGTDRLRQHYDWTRKHCPRKIRQENKWNGFKRQVQSYMDEIKGVKKKPAKAPAKPKTQKASGSTYTVRKNDSLWAIAKDNDTTVANLKKWNGLKSNVIHVGQKLNVKSPAKEPVAPPKPAAPKRKSIAQMADEVEAGKHGSGHANRRKSLGVDASTYAKVRTEINRRAGVKSTPKKKSKSVSQMADEVLAGKHGSGHANRQRSLGVNDTTYAKVRAEVNRRAGVSSSAPKRKSIAQMAQEVIDGKHGSGHANRQRSLGVSNAVYQKVRAEVNRRM